MSGRLQVQRVLSQVCKQYAKCLVKIQNKRDDSRLSITLILENNFGRLDVLKYGLVQLFFVKLLKYLFVFGKN